MTLSDIDALRVRAQEHDAAFQMDEETFRAFYERTAHGLSAYLARMTGDRQLAADLLQETYYRLLRSRTPLDSEVHRRNYLFRIATNLVRDGYRRRDPAHVSLDDERCEEIAGETGIAERVERRRDLHRAMAALRPLDRTMLWLAYAQGSTHEEIAAILGLRTGSLKPLLFRARQRLARLLRTGTDVERERTR